MNIYLDKLAKIGIVPVVKITAEEDSLPLARALKNGGIDCMEITFRSQYCLQAIKTITTHEPDILIGAGTVTNTQQAQAAVQAGASFIVTPAFNQEVVDWCLGQDIQVLPGVSTATELEMALKCGLDCVKFFPAESSGGVQKLKDLAGPYPGVKFMPTGGINLNNFHDYLSLPNVLAIGGSFMLRNDLVEAKNWDEIAELSAQSIKAMLDYQLIHLGINCESESESQTSATLISSLFNLKTYHKPKSNFAGKYFEFLNTPGRGKNGHVGIYTPYPSRALYQLNKKGIHECVDTITRNKKTNEINFVYLDIELNGFAFHLINPDVKM